MKAMDAIPAEFSTYAYYNADKFHFYGEDVMKHMTGLPHHDRGGITPAAGSDFSPGPFRALMAIQGMVTRTGWNGETWGANQKITVEEALRVNTINGAYNSREERSKDRSPRASSRTSWCWPTTSTPSDPTRSRTSRSCEQSSEATRSTRHDPMADSVTTALNGNATLSFVIPTGAKRSGGICSSADLPWRCFPRV